MHGYMSIVNTMLVENNLNVCTRQHWLQRVIIMCVRRQQPVRLSTFTTVSCVHAYMYVHFFIAFDPCICVHVKRQPKPCAVSTITWILAVTIHIACIGMYIHVSISFNPSQHISCTTFMSMHISTRVKSSMDIYVHVSICALDLSTNARVHVNRQHYALSTITWMCAYMSALASPQVIIMCVHRQQPVCVSTFTTKSVLRACLHVRTFFHCLQCVHMSIVKQSPMQCRQ